MRNYSIRKNKIISMVFVTILIILTILIISINFRSVSAETHNYNAIDAISKSMTSSINFNENGEQNNLLDYPNYLHNRFQLDNKNYGNLNVEDEWIKNIVPEQLFKQKIEDYFYIGDEYWNNVKQVDKCSAESNVSHLLSSRMSSRPMGWSKRGAERMAKLRAFKFNGGNIENLVNNQHKIKMSNHVFNGKRPYERIWDDENKIKAEEYIGVFNGNVLGYSGVRDELFKKPHKILQIY